MSAATSSTATVRRGSGATPTPARPATATTFRFASPDSGQDIKLNLDDIPTPPKSAEMDVEGFKPSFVSRLLDLLYGAKAR